MTKSKRLPDDFFNKKILEEVLAYLRTYNKEPFTFGFLEKFKINYDPDSNIDDLHDIIRKRIRSKREPPFLKDLVETIDDLKMWGRQHVFLFSLNQKHHDYLVKLRDPKYVKEQLKKNRASNRFNKNLYIWDAVSPVLAEVRHNYDEEKGGQLFFKWVETREYFETEEDKRGLKHQILKHERSVNFFLIHLGKGDAELRIQSLQNISQNTLRRQYDIYHKEINKIINFDLFSIIPMQPVVRLFLTKPMLSVNNWHMEYIGKKNVIGNGDPSVFSKVAIPFQNFLGKEITLAWECDQISQNRKSLVFTLNGESDEIRFNGVTDKLKLDFILNRLKRIALAPIELEEMKVLARIYPEYHRIFSSIDFYFSKLNKREISLNELLDRLWFTPETIQKVFQIIVDKYPKKFYFQDGKKEVIAMKNRFSIRGGLREYMKRGAEKKKHKTLLKNMVTPTLSIIYILLFIFKEEWGEWLKETVWDTILPGFPFIYFKIILFIVIATLFMGSRTIFKKFPHAVLTLMMKVGFNFNPDSLNKKLKKEFLDWEKQS